MIQNLGTLRRNLTTSRPLRLAFIAVTLISFTGCRSRFIETTIDNQSSSILQVVEVDYPSASFGVSNLAANSQFHYRFKIQGSGPLKLEYTDTQGKLHDFDGPELHQGEEGRLMITIDPTGKVIWQPNLTDAP